MFNIGRLCVKIAGRDAKGLAVVIGVNDNNSVLIEGTVRRRKCNLKHLEPTKHILNIKENATKEEVISKLKELGFEIPEIRKKVEKKEKSKKPKKGKKIKQKPVKFTKKVNTSKIEEKKAKKDNIKKEKDITKKSNTASETKTEVKKE